VWLLLWLYVAKYGELFKHLERILCARKTLVSYWFIVSCQFLDVGADVTLNQ
jgi:hypothetical protein